MPYVTVTTNQPPICRGYIPSTMLQPTVNGLHLGVITGQTPFYTVYSQPVRLTNDLVAVYVTVNPKKDRKRVVTYFYQLTGQTLTRRRANHHSVKTALTAQSTPVQFV